MSVIAGIAATIGAAAVVGAGTMILHSVMKPRAGADDGSPEVSVKRNAQEKQDDNTDVLKRAQQEEDDRAQSAFVERQQNDDTQKNEDEQKKKAEKERRDREEKAAREAEEQKKRQEEKKRAEEKKRQEDARLKAEEKKKASEKESGLNALFDMDKTQTATPFVASRLADTKRASLGDKRPDMRTLRTLTEQLTADIAMLTAKGLSPVQIVNNLNGKGKVTAPDELMPLIEAVSLILKQQENNRDAARVGIDAHFGIQAALNALARGEPQAALDVLEQAANRKSADIKIATTPHEKLDFMREAADLLRAKAVVERPFDFDKSVDSLNRSLTFDPSNAMTEALMARSYYETGATKTAKKMFSKLARGDENSFSTAYARQMVPKIAVERAFAHAQEIRKDYDDRLQVTEGYQKASQTMAIQRAAVRSNEEEREFVRQ